MTRSAGPIVSASAPEYTPDRFVASTKRLEFGGGVDIFYIHVDHLGSPRVVTSSSGSTQRWRWDNADPFGSQAANENPAGAGAFKFSVRFPGQYYDAEIGTHYNYHRDYDPAIGRYAQSDPIGLKGGLNTYVYVDDNPISKSDPLGLFGPGTHHDLSRQALARECPKLIGVASLAANIDFELDSQDLRYAFRHGMCRPGRDRNSEIVMIQNYIESNLKSCSPRGLANALHALQDTFSPSHRGCQVWYGDLTLGHIIGDAIGGRDGAQSASFALVGRFKSICPCACQ